MAGTDMQIPFSPYEGGEPYIFISYAHKNYSQVFPLIERLNRLKYHIWYDKGIEPGTEWPENIAQHLQRAMLVILFMSPEAAASVNVRRELTFAQNRSLNIITVFLKETELSSGLELQLAVTQNLFYYEYRSDDEFFEQLLSSGPLKNGGDPGGAGGADEIAAIDTSMLGVAMDYIRHGRKAIADVPSFACGALLSIEPDEITGFKSIQKLLAEYYAGSNMLPLALAAFGPYGSGRSFGIKQIARDTARETLTANISLMSDEKELSRFLFSIRNSALKGSIPLVFIDDFCAERFRWLKHFLSPVLDGQFKDEKGFHPLGRCVLVFTTTQYATYKEFLANTKDSAFRGAKGDELICSIKGAVNISGCNPASAKDKTVLIRRAILLRGFVERIPQKTPPAESLLRAMLLIPAYAYGGRSMQEVFSIVTADDFEMNRLSEHYQLAVHVDPDAFQNLLLREG